MLTLILVILLIALLCGGAWGYPTYGYAGFSPIVGLLVILLVLYALGVLHL